MKSLFISIPAYRDSELIPTLEDLYSKASGDYSLHPYVLLQEEGGELTNRLEELQSRFPQVNVIPIEARLSKGPCWARAWLQQFITHEEYYLQLDSHHRFVEEWDALMVEDLSVCPPKSLLTGYPSPYIPPNEYPPHHVPTKLEMSGLDADGIPHIEGSTPLLSEVKPVPGYLIAGGFILAPTSMCTEVPYDPEIYFKGEEISLAVRLWTHGWNIYHPHRVLLYHYYTRDHNSKHWDDNKEWVYLDKVSKDRVKTLLGLEHIHPHVDLGMYGLGKTRTLEEYQRMFNVHLGTTPTTH